MPRLLPEPAVPVTYEIARWFLDRARASDGHLPAQKLQNLLYLACVQYERRNGGRPLSSFSFIATEMTVVDPNLYRLLEEGRPKVRAEPVPSTVEALLDEVWTRYSHFTVEHLNTVVRRVLETGGELPEEAATAEEDTSPLLGRRHAVLADREEPASEPTSTLRPTHRGRRVAVTPWRPPSAPKSKK